MADLNNIDDDVNIAAKYLPYTLGILMGVPAFRTLRKTNPDQAMHPAVAKTLGWTGKLNHPDAIAEQRRLDDHILSRVGWRDRDQELNIPTDDLHFNYGWQRGPVVGLSREVPSTGMWVNKSNDQLLRHPAGDVTSALNLRPSVGLDLTGEYSGNRGYHSHSANPLEPGQAVLGKPHEGNWNKHNRFLIDQDALGTLEHELTHGSQRRSGQLYNYDWNIDWNKRPHEQEAEIAQFRYNNPKAYQIPFDAFMKANNPTSEYDLGKILRNYPRINNFEDVSPYFKDAGISLDGSRHGYRLRKWGTDYKDPNNYIDPNTLTPDLQKKFNSLRLTND